MKKLNKIGLLLVMMLFVSCQEEITLDLNNSTPYLVVDASINWEKGTLGNQQKILLSKVSPYYDSQTRKVSGAVVTVSNEAGQVFTFSESQTLGEYVCDDFVPVLNQEYTLYIAYQNQVYTAQERLVPVVDILNVEHQVKTFFGKELYEISYLFEDPISVTNYYISYLHYNKPLPKNNVMNDEYFDGNPMKGVYFMEKEEVSEPLSIELIGISSRCYDYMYKLFEVMNAGSGPFQTNVSTIRGNITNQTDADNYALGYFRLSEVSKVDYNVE
ncbi:MAG: DUF4249 domain-containing protein [Bacteroidota bacterium]|nr:DUF4249 domain-containing protein [Bacteroidota bacterium]